MRVWMALWMSTSYYYLWKFEKPELKSYGILWHSHQLTVLYEIINTTILVLITPFANSSIFTSVQLICFITLQIFALWILASIFWLYLSDHKHSRYIRNVSLLLFHLRIIFIIRMINIIHPELASSEFISWTSHIYNFSQFTRRWQRHLRVWLLCWWVRRMGSLAESSSWGRLLWQP